MFHTTSVLYEQLYKSFRNVQPIETTTLMSITTHIDPVDPLAFHQAGRSHQGERFYWSNHDRTLTLVGVGQAVSVDSEQEGFQVTEESWRKLLQAAAVDNPYSVSGTGPVAFGGFAFDPLKSPSATWGDFPNSSMMVPTFLLTKYKGEYYITINTIVEPGTSVEFKLESLAETCSELLEHALAPEATPYLVQQEEVAPEEWKHIVQKATEEIKQGTLGKVVLARELIATFSNDLHVTSLLSILEKQQHQSYIFAFERGESCFVGATPERLVKVEDRQLLSTCLAGTIPRGGTKEEDERLGTSLLTDEKNLQEHDFVVQMIREAIEACSDEVKVPTEPVLYPLRNLQHLYTPVQGKLRENYSILDVVKRLHPTPALGGYPVKESLEFIRNEEPFHRGWYASPVGWFDARDNGEFAVAIRSALIHRNQATLFAGCGVVEESQPEVEYEETAIKFLPMLNALGGYL
ncbi:isochorismate synthase MenF [Pontibacillus salicampi]|uniref:Isochorismate synthase MenF n=1 Tax=Pontibacillus salicampi TaxID=1449801 RepID=A0ABV6LNF7_9BACI